VFDEAARTWETDFRVLMPPMPGWAGTAPVRCEDYLPSALARGVESLAEEERFFVVGFSWGGTVGLRIDPGRLLGLALIDVGYQSYPEERRTYDDLIEDFADADFAPPEAAAAGMRGVGAEPAAEALPRMRDVPVLLLVATEPHVERRAADLDAFRATLPHAEVWVVKGAEHNVLETDPATAIPVIHAWLRRVAASAS
jgi:pimeloyl-ACP methyl ester carboxylesterase